MKKAQPISALIDFSLHDGYVESGGKNFYFYRYFPPNTDIMSAQEISEEIENLAALFDLMECPFAMFATNKVENLKHIRSYYASLDPRFDAITSEVIAQIDDSDDRGTSVLRAFYFIIPMTKQQDDTIYNALVGKGYTVQPAEREEIATLLRNYFVREFLSAEINTLEQLILQNKKVAKRVKKDPRIMTKELERRLLPHRIDFHVNCAVINEQYRKTVMVRNLPTEIPPCALMRAATMRGTSFMMRLTPMLSSEVKRMVDAQLNNKKVGFGSGKFTEQIEATDESRTLVEFYKSISTERRQVYYTSIYIELYAASEQDMKLRLDDLQEKLPTGVTIDRLQREQKDAFLLVNPWGSDRFQTEANNLPSLSAAALYPFSYSSRLDERGMLLGETKTGGPFFLDLRQRNAYLTNSNFSIIGDSGQGKSTLMKKIIEFLSVFGVTCLTLDPENEYGQLFRALGGTIYKCVDNRALINPLEVRWLYRDDEGEDEEDILVNEMKNQAMFFQHISWLKDFFRVLFPGISDLDVQALMILTQEMYNAHGIGKNTDFTKLSAADYPTFSDLYEYIDQYDTTASKIMDKETVGRLLLRLRECYDGPLSLLFNGHTNIQNANMICFEAMELLEGSKDRTQAVLFNLTTWIWTQVLRRERAIALNLDELYLFFENMIMVKYISSFVKRARKYNAMIGVATQQLLDCLRPDIAPYTTALLNNSTYKFLFHPGKIDMALVQEKLALTAGEAAAIALPHQGYCLVKAGRDRYYVHIEKMPYEDELFGTGGGK